VVLLQAGVRECRTSRRSGVGLEDAAQLRERLGRIVSPVYEEKQGSLHVRSLREEVPQLRLEVLCEGAQERVQQMQPFWQVDQTYTKVAGQWRYVYRAIDQFGQVIDVFVSQRRYGCPPLLRASRRDSAPPRHRLIAQAGQQVCEPGAGSPGQQTKVDSLLPSATFLRPTLAIEDASRIIPPWWGGSVVQAW
jgi:DDE domain